MGREERERGEGEREGKGGGKEEVAGNRKRKGERNGRRREAFRLQQFSIYTPVCDLLILAIPVKVSSHAG